VSVDDEIVVTESDCPQVYKFQLNANKQAILYERYFCSRAYEGGPKNNRNLNVARELELVARCAARCRESTQYSSSLPRGVSLD
jgi:hypothetical protein